MAQQGGLASIHTVPETESSSNINPSLVNPALMGRVFSSSVGSVSTVASSEQSDEDRYKHLHKQLGAYAGYRFNPRNIARPEFNDEEDSGLDRRTGLDLLEQQIQCIQKLIDKGIYPKPENELSLKVMSIDYACIRVALLFKSSAQEQALNEMDALIQKTASEANKDWLFKLTATTAPENLVVVRLHTLEIIMKPYLLRIDLSCQTRNFEKALSDISDVRKYLSDYKEVLSAFPKTNMEDQFKEIQELKEAIEAAQSSCAFRRNSSKHLSAAAIPEL